MTRNSLTTLKQYDAAPERPLTDSERSRSNELLREVLADSGVAPTAYKPNARAKGWGFAAVGAAAALVAAGVVVAAPHLIHHTIDASGPLTSVELAGWTSTPQHVTHAASASAQSWCLNLMATGPASGDTATISNQDQRGQVASMIVHRGGYSMLCIAGGDGTGFWELDGSPTDPKPTVAADGITLESAGSHGDGDTGFTYVEGYVGSDVASITVKDAGKTFAATVDAGRWTAWWPTPDPHGTVTGTVTITTTDGASHTVAGESLQK